MTESFGTHVVYVDESGDHGLTSIDQNYPVFVLTFCLFKKSDYVEKICPELQNLKMRYWGHDEVVLHEREIRKPNKQFSFLFDTHTREAFLNDLNNFVRGSKFLLIASVIKKQDLQNQYVTPENPYQLALGFGLERLFFELKSLGQAEKTTTIVVEMRGKKEDTELELAFRRICDGANGAGQKLPFELVMVSKAANSTGLQLADLFARPIGLKVLRPDQENRAYGIVEGKLRRSPSGTIKGWGLKVFP
jgi:hypothetical protein